MIERAKRLVTIDLPRPVGVVIRVKVFKVSNLPR
jgi:hypothetical protein